MRNIEALLKMAESKISSDLPLSERLNQFPFNLTRHMHKFILKMTNWLFREQRLVNLVAGILIIPVKFQYTILQRLKKKKTLLGKNPVQSRVTVNTRTVRHAKDSFGSLPDCWRCKRKTDVRQRFYSARLGLGSRIR